MNSKINSGRIVGILLLLTFILGVLINQFLQGPILFSEDFLNKVSANSNQVVLSILLGLTNSILALVIAVILLPIFKQSNYSLAFLYLAFSVISFATILIDNTGILTILGLSNEYVAAGASEAGYFELIGAVFYQARWWTHYMTLLISSLPFFVFYYLFYQTKLIPRYVSVWGLLAALLMLVEVLSSMFGQSLGMILFLPLGLNQLFLATWLIIKGLKSPPKDSIA